MSSLSRRGLLSAFAFLGDAIFSFKPRAAEATGDWNALITGMGFPKALQTNIKLPGGILTGSTEVARIAFGQKKDIVVDGNKSILKLEGRGGPFLFKNCENISLRNFTVDLQNPGFIQADLVESKLMGRRITVRVQPGFPAPVLDEVISIFAFDKKTNGPAPGSVELGRGRFVSITPAGPSLYEIEFSAPFQFSGDVTLIMRRKSGSGPAFIFENCKNIEIDQVAITSAPQMGLVFRRCENLTVQNLSIKPAAGSGRLLATAADGLHTQQTRGKIKLSNCTFDGLGDDCINVHDFYLRSASWKGRDTLLLTEHTDFAVQHSIKSSDALPLVGDTVQLLDPVTLNVLKEIKIAGIDASANQPSLQLSTPVDNNIEGQQVLVCAASSAPDLTIDHCRFSRTRAHGVVTHAKSKIQDCVFENLGLAGVAVVAEAQFWGEGCGAAHVAVTNSTFQTCGAFHSPSGVAVSMLGAKGSAQVTSSGTDITITGNKFNACAAPVLSIANINGLTVSSNSFSWKEAVAVPSVKFQQISNLTFEANKSSPESDMSLPQTAKPALKNNTGFRMKS